MGPERPDWVRSNLTVPNLASSGWVSGVPSSDLEIHQDEINHVFHQKGTWLTGTPVLNNA